MCVKLRGMNTVPYRPVQPVYTVPANKLVRLTPLFCTIKNTGRTGQFRAIPAGTGLIGRYKKKVLLLLLLFFFKVL